MLWRRRLSPVNCDNAKSQVNTQSGRRHKRNLRPAHCDDVICQQANSTVELKRPHRQALPHSYWHSPPPVHEPHSDPARPNSKHHDPARPNSEHHDPARSNSELQDPAPAKLVRPLALPHHFLFHRKSQKQKRLRTCSLQAKIS